MDINTHKALSTELDNLRAIIGRIQQILDDEKVEFEPPIVDEKELKYN